MGGHESSEMRGSNLRAINDGIADRCPPIIAFCEGFIAIFESLRLLHLDKMRILFWKLGHGFVFLYNYLFSAMYVNTYTYVSFPVYYCLFMATSKYFTIDFLENFDGTLLYHE